MNNEITEILDYFKDDIEFLEKELINTNFLGRYITIRDKECGYLKKLLDYITNLQQENERLQKRNKEIYDGFIATQEELSDYAKENEKIKSRIEKAVEYGNSCINKDLDLETLDEPYKTTFKTAYEIHNNYLDILNGRSDE